MYPNPYMMNMVPKTGLLTRSIAALKSIKCGTLLEGTQKTLGVINQAIPVVYQIKPIVNNAKTLFRIAGSINDNSTPQEEIIPSPTPTPNVATTNSQSTTPIFYI